MVTVVDKVWSKRAGQEIVSRLDKLFKNNIIRVRYWIIVNYYAPNHGYNFFFNIYRPYHFTRSISIGQLSNCSFEELIMVLNEIRMKYCILQAKSAEKCNGFLHSFAAYLLFNLVVR